MTTTSAQPATKETRWSIDASHSSVSFAVRHLMISNVRGVFRKFSGSTVYDPAHPEDAKLSATVEVASIDTHDEKRDGHLKSPDFFDAEKFPTMNFTSKSVKRHKDGLEIKGDLTIHGATREIELTVDEVTGEHGDPWGNRRVGATAKTKIRRSEFGMEWNSVLEAGGVLVGDEISITIEVELLKQA